MFYVNLPLSYIFKDEHYLSLFLDYRNRAADAAEASGLELGLELGMDATALQHIPHDWHRELAGRLRQNGAHLGVHLPFQDLAPGSKDDLVRQASHERLQSAFELARLYTPDHMVGHPLYLDSTWGGEHHEWVRLSSQTWGALLDDWDGHPPLFLENVYEQSPEPLAALMHELDSGTTRGRNVGICFDVGHWHSFSRGGELGNLEQWITALSPWIRHLHLHDNDGSGDQHLGLGKGGIDFGHFFHLLSNCGIAPGATFEPHSEEAFAQSLSFIHLNPDLFSGLGG